MTIGLAGVYVILTWLAVRNNGELLVSSERLIEMGVGGLLLGGLYACSMIIYDQGLWSLLK